MTFVLDNHSSHKNKDRILKTLDSLGVKLLFLPPYSSEFNPIEKIWAIIKLEWRKAVMNWDGDAKFDSSK